MVLEFVEGRTMYEVVKARPELTNGQKVDYHNQLLDGLTHLHSYGLSHGDISLLNIQVTHSSNTIKLLDFGRSVSADSDYCSLENDPIDPFDFLARISSLIDDTVNIVSHDTYPNLSIAEQAAPDFAIMKQKMFAFSFVP